MSENVAKLLRRFRARYGDPRADNADTFRAEYDRSLKGFSAAVLERAGDELVDRLIDGKARRFWPTISECRAKCLWAAGSIAAEAKQREKPEMPAEYEQARVRNLVRQYEASMASANLMGPPLRDILGLHRKW